LVYSGTVGVKMATRLGHQGLRTRLKGRGRQLKGGSGRQEVGPARLQGRGKVSGEVLGAQMSCNWLSQKSSSRAFITRTVKLGEKLKKERKGRKITENPKGFYFTSMQNESWIGVPLGRTLRRISRKGHYSARKKYGWPARRFPDGLKARINGHLLGLRTAKAARLG